MLSTDIMSKKDQESTRTEPLVVGTATDTPDIDNKSTDASFETSQAATSANIAAMEQVAEDSDEPAHDVVEPRVKGKPGLPVVAWARQHPRKVLLAVGATLLVAGVAVWFTDARYAVQNAFGSAQVNITVVDSKTSQPIPDVKILLADASYTTDAKGTLSVQKVAFGKQTIKASKSAYAESSKMFVVDSSAQSVRLSLHPTGTPLTFMIMNYVTGRPVSGAKVSFGDSSALADAKGAVAMTIPPQTSNDVTLKLVASGYNDASLKVTLGKTGAASVSMVPAGKLYFLSKASGTIDIVKTDLDGTNRKVVLAGTGKELDQSTVLLATRDWKYLMLRARRDSANEALYIVDTHDDSTTLVDKASTDISPTGWVDHKFIYSATNDSVAYTAAGRSLIKSYNADASKLTTVDQNQAMPEAGAVQSFSSLSIVGDGYLYGRNWGYAASGRQTEIVLVDAQGTKKVLKTYASEEVSSVYIAVTAPEAAYIGLLANTGEPKVVEYSAGRIKDTTAISFNDVVTTVFPTKVVSPSDKLTYWAEDRDGKKTLLAGDQSGQSGKVTLNQGEYAVYGWYGDDYVLLSKDGSQLYIAPAHVDGQLKPIKLSDYHKPTYNLRGYGYGYGGY